MLSTLTVIAMILRSIVNTGLTRLEEIRSAWYLGVDLARLWRTQTFTLLGKQEVAAAVEQSRSVIQVADQQKHLHHTCLTTTCGSMLSYA